MSIWQRLLAAIGRVLSAFFNIRIKLKYVLVLVILLVAGCIGVTYNKMINAVGGKADYDEAMRYIEIKDLVDEYFIDPADRTAMGNSAAAAMISGLGDKWSYYMSADEYRTYQLYSTNEYSSIGMSIMQDANGGGYQVISVNPDTPAAKAGITSGMDHTTYAHTGAMVNLYAKGVGAENFRGVFDNTEIYHKLAELTGVQ